MEENNKIIVEFLGWEKIYLEGYVEYILPESLADPIYKLDSRFILEFDTDWNWLMKVVEKIEDLHVANTVVFAGKNCFLNIHDKYKNELVYFKILSESKIEAVYNACVEFIKWYNQNKEKEN